VLDLAAAATADLFQGSNDGDRKMFSARRERQ
jgi:hypothetical protein